MLGRVGRDVVNVLLLTSLFACVLSFHNVIARYQFVLSGRGLLPGRLGVVHPTRHSPAFSSVVQTITAAVIVLLMFTTSVAVLVYFVRHRAEAGGRPWQTRVAPALAAAPSAGAASSPLPPVCVVAGEAVACPSPGPTAIANFPGAVHLYPYGHLIAPT